MESDERSPKQRHEHHLQILSPKSPSHHKNERFLDFLKATPSKEWLQRLGFSARLSPYSFVKRMGSLRARSSMLPAPGGFLRAPAFARTVDWSALRSKCVAWAKHPMNAALLVWLAFVAAGVVFVFLLMTGALNSAMPGPSQRRRWTEIANQMLNALFTIMCVYQHPQLCHHLVLLVRWRASDIAELRGVYCKNGAEGLAANLHERLHVAVVVLLFHVTCFAQYGYCGLFWFYNSEMRPAWAVNFCMALGLVAPIVAGLYMIYGPLGRKIVLPASSDEDEEAAVVQDEALAEANAMALQQCRSGSCRVVVTKPAWAGGLFDLGDDPTVAAISVSCTFCVFGWNMERLGFGNMYVHVFTFALLSVAPLLVFAVAALHIHDDALRFLVGATGALLSVFGLMYGGFWRAQMRRRFGLPADRSTCCGRPVVADYAKWLFCGPCALAQEVRTGNFYDAEEHGLYVKEGGEKAQEVTTLAMAPLEREGCVTPLTLDKADEGAKCTVAVDAPPVPVRVQGRV